MYVFEAHALSGWYDAKNLIKTFLNNMSCYLVFQSNI